MFTALLFGLFFGLAQAGSSGAEIRGLVVDENGAAVAGASISVRTTDGSIWRGSSDETGHFNAPRVAAGAASATLSKPGFFQLKDAPLTLAEGANEATFTLAREQELHEEIDVVSSKDSVAPDSIPQQEILTAREIREIPVPSSHSLQNALPALAPVVQDSSGKLHVAGARTRDTQYVLDGFEVGDPLTGEFSSRINVDSVQTVTVQPGQIDARWAHPGAGVVHIETPTGDDHWRFTTTNFLPDLSFESGVRLGNWYPRFTFSGPLIKGRLWFTDGLSWQHNLNIVPELPRNENTASRTAVDNLMRLRFKLNNTHSFESSFLWNDAKNTYEGLGALAPPPTTTTNTSSRYLISLKDQITVGPALIEAGFARDASDARRLPQGAEPYTYLPDGPRGNYFERSQEGVQRWQFMANVFLPSRRWMGKHDIQAGFKADQIHLDRDAERSPIRILDSAYTLTRESLFSGSGRLAMSHAQGGIYAQDTWRIIRPIVVQVGSRLDWDRTLQRTVLRPSIAFDWIPSSSGSGKLVAALGMYSDPTDLSLFAQTLDQQRVDVFYSPASNDEAPAVRHTRFVLPTRTLQMPSFTTATVGWEQQLREHTRMQVNWIRRNQHHGFVFENVSAAWSDNLFLLENSREDRYHAFHVSLDHAAPGRGDFSIDYIRSVARSNKVTEYSIMQLQGGPQAAGRLGWDAPNRLISHGSAQTGIWRLLFSYFFEYRTGFPFNIIDAQDQIVGEANHARFPDYWNLNVAGEKRVKWRKREWAVRLSVLNVTNHRNANAVINNLDSTNFGQFGGGQRRAVTARLRLVGRS